MKILAIHNYYQIRSGEDLAFDASVAALRARGHTVDLLTVDNSEMKRLALVLSAMGAAFNLRRFWQTFKEARRQKPDLALVQNVFPRLSPSIYFALKFAGVPVVQRVYNYRAICPNGILYTQSKICERCAHGAYWNAVRFKCYRSSFSASLIMAKAVAFARVTGVWRWGVQRFLTPDRFLGTKLQIATRSSDSIRTVFNPAPESSLNRKPVFSGRNQRILFIGRHVRAKGIWCLLDVAQAMPGRTFVIVGGGEESETAQAEATRRGLKNIEWKGAVYGADLLLLLETEGALILPSQWYDNMPLVLTQALLAGIPIVASDINGIPEFVMEGVTGRLAHPARPSDFARRLEEVFSQPEVTQKLAQEGARRSQDWFLPDASAASLERELLAALPFSS